MLTYIEWKTSINDDSDLGMVLVVTGFSIITILLDIILSPIELIALFMYKVVLRR